MSVEATIQDVQKSQSNDKSPLLRTNSTPQVIFRARKPNRKSNSLDIQECDKTDLPQSQGTNCNDEETDENHPSSSFVKRSYCDKIESQADIAAMSVLSLYLKGDSLESEMDTDR